MTFNLFCTVAAEVGGEGSPPPTFAPCIALRMFGLSPVPGWECRKKADLVGQKGLDRMGHSVIARMQTQVE